MSEVSNLITKEHFDYIADRTAREDEFLRDLKSHARAEGIPSIWISAEQASLMQILLRLCRAREVVEVGTLAGYSAIWMARALPPEGRVRTIEISGKHADFAERWVAKSDVAAKIRIFRGSGREILPTIQAESADAVFLDADKASYPDYLKESLRIVRPGGLIMADNAFAFGSLFDRNESDPDIEAIRAFNDIMARQTALQSIILPLGDGLWVGVRR